MIDIDVEADHLVQKLTDGLIDHRTVSVLIAGRTDPIEIVEAESTARVLHLRIVGGGSAYVRESALVAVFVGPVPIVDEAADPFHLDDGTEIVVEATPDA